MVYEMVHNFPFFINVERVKHETGRFFLFTSSLAA